MTNLKAPLAGGPKIVHIPHQSVSTAGLQHIVIKNALELAERLIEFAFVKMALY